MRTTKKEFIKYYLKIIKKKLERPEIEDGLPEEDFEFNMVKFAKEIIRRHVWGER